MSWWETSEQWVARLAPAIGAAISMNYLAGPWYSRLASAVGGYAFGVLFGEWVAAKTSLPETGAGFLLGLFGMAIMSGVFNAIGASAFDFSKLPIIGKYIIRKERP